MGRKSARFIARASGVSAECVNQILEKMGYIRQIIPKGWFITEEGEQHGQYSETQFEVPIWDEQTQKQIMDELKRMAKNEKTANEGKGE